MSKRCEVKSKVREISVENVGAEGASKKDVRRCSPSRQGFRSENREKDVEPHRDGPDNDAQRFVMSHDDLEYRR